MHIVYHLSFLLCRWATIWLKKKKKKSENDSISLHAGFVNKSFLIFILSECNQFFFACLSVRFVSFCSFTHFLSKFFFLHLFSYLRTRKKFVKLSAKFIARFIRCVQKDFQHWWFRDMCSFRFVCLSSSYATILYS